MAQTEHLSIYKASYDLCLHPEQVVSRFGRAHPYRLGVELREAVEDLKVLCRLGPDVEALEASSPPPVAARADCECGAPQAAEAEPSAARYCFCQPHRSRKAWERPASGSGEWSLSDSLAHPWI